MSGTPLPTDHATLILLLGIAGATLGAWLGAARRWAHSPAAVRAASLPSRPVPSRNEPLLYGSASERREWSRRKGGRVKVRLAGGGAQEQVCAAWIIDRSTGGLCLRVPARLEAGAVVSVRPVHAPERMSWVRVEVRSCRECPDGWEVGCRFVRRPSWDVMLHFG
jgi:hypothetical protein